MTEAMADRTGTSSLSKRIRAETDPRGQDSRPPAYARSAPPDGTGPAGCWRWIGEQYTARADLLAVLMARLSTDPETVKRGRVTEQMANRRIQAWRRPAWCSRRSSWPTRRPRCG